MESTGDFFCETKIILYCHGNLNTKIYLYETSGFNTHEILNNYLSRYHWFISDLSENGKLRPETSSYLHNKLSGNIQYQCNINQGLTILKSNWDEIKYSETEPLKAKVVLYRIVAKGYKTYITRYLLHLLCQYESKCILLQQYTTMIPVNHLLIKGICKISSKWPSIVGAVHNKDCVKYGYTRDNPYNETKQESCSNSSTEFDVRLTIQKYIFPSVFGVMLVVGLSGNGILLLIFIRDKASRTAPNALIFNLVVADIVHLVVNTPAYYVIKYYSPKIHLGNTGCEVYIACRIVNLAAMYVSVVATSAQRYFAIKSTLRPEECCCRLRTKFNVCIYILIVWLVAIGIGLPATLLFEFREYPCYPKVKDDQVKKSVNMAYIFCTTTAPPLLVIIFNTLTARLLRRSIRKTPGIVRNNAQEVSRYRCANIIIALTIAFCICYIPRNIWFFISSNFHLNPNGVKYAWEEEITLYFLISNSLQNPIALYIASTFFRERMKMYLFCRNSNRELRNL